MEASRRTVSVIGSPIDVIDWQQAIERISAWSRQHLSRVVCVCNVHSVITAQRDPQFAQVLREADLCTPDGEPVAWMMRRQGQAAQLRIDGPDLMWRYCGWAAEQGESIYLYGSSVTTLGLLQQRLQVAFPALQVAGAWSPPYRPLSAEEDAAAVAAINASGAGTVWVSLGCPKQERWMHDHRGRIDAVMVGVGAAFEYHAGTHPRAPVWAQRAGLEWLHRLIIEPRRLWRRYLLTNTLFVIAAARQLLRGPHR